TNFPPRTAKPAKLRLPHGSFKTLRLSHSTTCSIIGQLDTPKVYKLQVLFHQLETHMCIKVEEGPSYSPQESRAITDLLDSDITQHVPKIGTIPAQLRSPSTNLLKC
uniref:Uncharacterized protein n=1 Tax=Astyanax mexicanus TaxID=7994 RepID=A0A8B9HLP0_ASTMX